MSTVFRIEKKANYTVMSNHHLRNRELSLKAKGLLSVMLSLPEEWDYTLSGLSAISKESVDAIRTAINELENLGYIHREQLRDERGRLAHNEYLVYECPEDNPYFDFDNTDVGTASTNPTSGRSCPKKTPPTKVADDNAENADTVKSKAKPKKLTVKPSSPSLENPTTVKKEGDLPLLENPITDNPTTENPTTDTYNKLNKDKSNKESIYQSNDSIDVIDSQSEREFYFSVLKENIYGDENAKGDEETNELIAIMLDVICSTKPTIRVNGEELPKEVVKSVFLKLDEGHIDYVLTALKKNTTEVRNIRAYLITALYNAPSTIDSYYRSWVNHDSTVRQQPENPLSESNSSFDTGEVMSRLKSRYKGG